MKAVRIITVLLLCAAASAAYVWLRPSTESNAVNEPVAMPAGPEREVRMMDAATSEAPAAEPEPVQPLEERGDAMLFEIDALQNTPFDEAITMPFD